MGRMFSYTSRLSRAAASAACRKAKPYISMSLKARRGFRQRTSRPSNEIDFQQGAASAALFFFIGRGRLNISFLLEPKVSRDFPQPLTSPIESKFPTIRFPVQKLPANRTLCLGGRLFVWPSG